MVEIREILLSFEKKRAEKKEFGPKAFKAYEKGPRIKRNSNRECYICGKIGHIARECWHKSNTDNQTNKDSTKWQGRGRGNRRGIGKREEHAKAVNTAEQRNKRFNNEKEYAFHAFDRENNQENEEPNKWFLDSACTSHMTAHKDWMCNEKSTWMERKRNVLDS